MPAADEDTLPFASANRPGWGEPKEVKRVATLECIVKQAARLVNVEDAAGRAGRESASF
jgi:hypothetical protein